MKKNERKSKVVTEGVLHRFKKKVESGGEAVQTIPECEKTIDVKNFVQRVERQAYELYVKRGFEFGHEWDDWFEAEKIVEAEMSTVDKDCIRSESFYKVTHRSNPLPSDIDAQKIKAGPLAKDF